MSRDHDPGRTLTFEGATLDAARCWRCDTNASTRYRDRDAFGWLVADCSYCDELFSLTPKDEHAMREPQRLTDRLKQIQTEGW